MDENNDDHGRARGVGPDGLSPAVDESFVRYPDEWSGLGPVPSAAAAKALVTPSRAASTESAGAPAGSCWLSSQ